MRMDRAQEGVVSTLSSHLLNRAHLGPFFCLGTEGRLSCRFPKELLLFTNSPAFPLSPYKSLSYLSMFHLGETVTCSLNKTLRTRDQESYPRRPRQTCRQGEGPLS